MTRSVTDIIAGLGTGVYVNGQWRDAASGATFDVVNPATGEAIATLADGGADDATAAISAAGRAQESWAAVPARERAEILRRAYELLVYRADEIALLMTTEMGKPLAEARGEVSYGAEFFRWFSEEASRIHGDARRSPDGKTRLMVTQEPVGPSILITPWNFPLAMATRKIGPAVAAGCTMVFKPANLTPLTSLYVVDVLREAGLPEGVLNVVCTTDAGGVVEPWIDSGIARKLSFTGSTPVGRKLLEQCSRGVLRTSMELGGNAPFVVCEDADMDTAVDAAMAAKMRNMGEACTSANRILVHRSVLDEFGRRLTERMASLTVGDGTAEGTDVGPLVEEKAVDKVAELVDDAVSRGAAVLTGGTRGEGPGFFYPPTVLTGVTPDARLMSTEIFGPVAALVPFDTDDEAVALANDTEYGLVSYVMTENLDRAMTMSERLQAGMVGINVGVVSNPAAPFGGIKQSGLGREGGTTGIEEFLETKLVAIPVR
ncbi:NAD-dependent succinate-semialdehyde dehydrogenase [Dietzia cinnamea]|uniref:NAD-dependent succinate-semialdehyde dehydrogenase n=1 Tax=Dietzia cinnamea TaxID=321318 RepID=A0ABV3YHW6_9ACTN|nr:MULTISPECIES: NAD-dependent succinate-semialdehyde dehydrogenase [Dietzia]AVM64519.1 NAD-dependent succinate-semialdehyde dehydrogenase [Dietzia sp. oral taxon 368]MCT1638866.1 NAD-dependent succinate-semialdehyde dehydrogenase [Dietzia cinnamea]MCT1710809.1 NAD-dependent succinate-semialdehyde dehydrogenase [Dietzia cinnamea]MCT1883785.1 NAD-dependent succinate-semialdehyde dehydrogenase [Dietzia cinnamea]MCT2097054.1 NAD-dependent succinate-semialdehyde dehydrogenase [Dietzia cinnamea]